MYEEAECACFPKNKEKKIQTWRGRKAKKAENKYTPCHSEVTMTRALSYLFGTRQLT